MTALSMGGIFGLFGVHFGTASGECATQNDYLIKLCGFIGWMMRGERDALSEKRSEETRQSTAWKLCAVVVFSLVVEHQAMSSNYMHIQS